MQKVSVVLPCYNGSKWISKAPVLGSKVRGMPELIYYSKLMFQPANHIELAYKLKILLKSNKKYSNLRKLIIERRIFTFDHNVYNQTIISTSFKKRI